MSKPKDSNIIGTNYRVGKKIGEGTFGVVFEGLNLLDDQRIAIKFEPKKTANGMIEDEARVLQALKGMLGIPQFYACFTEGLHRILITTLLGPTLEDLFDKCSRIFSLQTVRLIAIQLVIHEYGFIYEYTAPENFLIGPPGTPDEATIYMIDFGMAKRYKDAKNNRHVSYKKLVTSGSPRFMSIRAHEGMQRSRRDDLETLGYLLLYFARGGLPWIGKSKGKMEEMKKLADIDDLCANLPSAFKTYMFYVKGLTFEAQPDYQHLITLFSTMPHKFEPNLNFFDWNRLDSLQTQQIPTSNQLNLPHQIPQLSHTTDQISDRQEETVLPTRSINRDSLAGAHNTQSQVTNSSSLEATDKLWIEQHQKLLREHREEIVSLRNEYNESLAQIRKENAENLRANIVNLQTALTEEKEKALTRELEHESEIKAIKIEFNLEMDRVHSEAEEMENSHVLASQRREQRLTEVMEKSIQEERAKNAKLQMELNDLKEQFERQNINSAKLPQLHETSTETPHVQHTFNDEVPSDMIDEDEIEYHHV